MQQWWGLGRLNWSVQCPTDDIAPAASCGAIISPEGNRVVDAVPGLIQPRFRPHCRSGLGGGTGWGFNMSSIDCAKRSYFSSYLSSCVSSYVAINPNHIPDALFLSGARVRNVIQLFPVVLGAALLAACAQSSVVSRNSGFVGHSQ